MVVSIFIMIPLVHSALVDTFDRANSASLGTATNGNTWTESGEDASCFFDINTNDMRFRADGCDATNTIATLPLTLATNITVTGGTIGITNLTSNSGASGNGVIVFMQSETEVFTLFGNPVEGWYRNITVNVNPGSTENNLIVASNPIANDDLRFIIHLDNDTVSIEGNNGQANARMIGLADVTYVDTIRMRYGDSTGDSTFFNYEEINVTTAAASDSCTYGGSGDFVIDATENCAVSSNADVGNNKVIVKGSGIIDITGKIVDFSQIIVNNGAQLICRNTAGCFGG
jgi:hypothetical protein